MDIKEQINLVNLEKQAVMQKYANLKTAFRSYITDKNIPVVERWDYFIGAPSELKNSKDYIWHPKSEFLKNVFRKFSEIPEVYGRGKTIYLSKLFDDIIWEGEICMENVYDEKTTEEDVKNGLEEILAQNLEYFKFDW